MGDVQRKKLAIMGATGKLAYATLTSLLDCHLMAPSDIIATTSATSDSSAQWTKLSSLGVTVRHATFDSRSSIKSALQDCEALFLLSSPRIAMDFSDVQHGHGREADHITALDAAAAAGVKHVYYTSLAFSRPSKAGVMRAHIATEEYLEQQVAGKGMDWTIIRQGKDERTKVKVAGDGVIPWTSIADLGAVNARILSAPKEGYLGKTLHLCDRKNRMSLGEVTELVGKALGRELDVDVVERKDHERFYIEERGMDPGLVRWWASTYDALRIGECDVEDDTFARLIAEAGRNPITMEQTIAKMTGGSA